MTHKITVPFIKGMKDKKEAITVLTAYDYQMASLLDKSGIDILLVGDSLGNVIYGFDNTLPVTMEMMIAHTAAVVRGRQKALIVADMPFMSYQASTEDAIRNSGRLVKEAGAEAVKLEGGASIAETVRRIVGIDIPVMGHIGLKPQSVNAMGGYKIQGRKKEERKKLIDDARAIEEAGAFAIVLEGIPADAAKEITLCLSIPTIGIGAGPDCDGQVLVINDLLGLSDFKPKFVRNFAFLSESITDAVKDYIQEVKEKTFPSKEESFGEQDIP
ncbi:MAG: 3-methyl-2-oxobutanoate hydroxymethyltransferase [Proteobacteria bacterium]|nr:3-methyl-2-oxobutanoate hydroxymethyltransferase [Pseudomonadota bacterium]